MVSGVVTRSSGKAAGRVMCSFVAHERPRTQHDGVVDRQNPVNVAGRPTQVSATQHAVPSRLRVAIGKSTFQPNCMRRS